VKTSCLEPDVLVGWALFTASPDKFSCRYHSIGMLFETSGCDPPWCVLRVRFDEGVEEHPCSLDVTDFCIRLEDYTVE
jgi:hypothetical protein